ncbi:MAG: TlpA family protein disulfide reductase [Actinomycetota bacterium]
MSTDPGPPEPSAESRHDERIQEDHGHQSRARWRRLVLVLVPAVALLAVLGAAVMRSGSAPQPGDPAPDFEAPLLTGGGTLALDDLDGKPVVLNFWASWCVPCKDEAPMLSRAAAAFGDRVAFVGVDVKDAHSDAVAFVEDQDLDYLHVRDEDETIFRDYGLTGQPETFFIDDEGVIVEHVNGPLPQDALDQLVETLVARSG